MKQDLRKLLNEYRENNKEIKSMDDYRKDIHYLLENNFEKIKSQNLYYIQPEEKIVRKYKKKISIKQAKSLFKKVHVFIDGSINKKDTLKTWRDFYPKIRKNQAKTMIDWLNINVSTYKVDIDSSLTNWKKEGYIYEKES